MYASNAQIRVRILKTTSGSVQDDIIDKMPVLSIVLYLVLFLIHNYPYLTGIC